MTVLVDFGVILFIASVGISISGGLLKARAPTLQGSRADESMCNLGKLLLLIESLLGRGPCGFAVRNGLSEIRLLLINSGAAFLNTVSRA